MMERQTHSDQTGSQSSSHEPLNPSNSPRDPLLGVRAEHVLSSDEQLLEHERHREQQHKRPRKDRTKREEERRKVHSSGRARSGGRGRLEVKRVREQGRVQRR